MVPVLTPEQCQAWDRAAEAAGRPLRMLMETAGRAVARAVVQHHGEAARGGVLVACGPGNNGGDGWVAARALHCHGHRVAVVESAAPAAGIAAEARRAALEDGVPLLDADAPWPAVTLLVDALLGTGASGAPRGTVATLTARLASLSLPVVAVDGPTGLDLATGEDHGALRAATTVTFGGPRRGHLRARDAIGNLVVSEIGFPRADPAWPRLVDRCWAAAHLPGFASNVHKGDRGRVVIVGGSEGMSGAARLAARAAFAAGAGLVHVVTTPASASDLSTAEPDLQVRGHRFAAPLDPELIALLSGADAVVIGPGLGRDGGRADFVLAVLGHARRAVLDADGLSVLAGAAASLDGATAGPLILTPHPGEYRTLFADLAAELDDPWNAASAASVASGATVLLKGVPTVVATGAEAPLTIAAGNPGLATGGSGDVLSGIIGALLGAGVEPHVAAAAGAQALGDAADLAAARVGVRGMRPMDVIGALPEVWAAWREAANDPPPEALRWLPRPAGA